MYLLFTAYGVGRNDFDAGKSISKRLEVEKWNFFAQKVSIFQGPPLPTALEMTDSNKV